MIKWLIDNDGGGIERERERDKREKERMRTPKNGMVHDER
jgi:hypothetical protein